MFLCFSDVVLVTQQDSTAADGTLNYIFKVTFGVVRHENVVSQAFVVTIIDLAFDFGLVKHVAQQGVNVYEIVTLAVGTFFLLHLVEAGRTEKEVLALSTCLRLVDETETNGTLIVVFVVDELAVIHKFLKFNITDCLRSQNLMYKLLLSHLILRFLY